MAETKEGIPLTPDVPESLRPNQPQSLQPPILYIPMHPLDVYLKKTPAELQEEARKLQSAADTFKKHWSFVFLGIGLTLFGYYRNIQTTRTLSEIRDYVRTRKGANPKRRKRQ